MSDAESTSRTNPDGTVTVTLAAGLNGKDWMAAADEILALYSGRYTHWFVDAEGRDVFVIAAPVAVAPPTCGLCAAGQPHSYGHGHGTVGGV
jgi:hypothetical protein